MHLFTIETSNTLGQRIMVVLLLLPFFQSLQAAEIGNWEFNFETAMESRYFADSGLYTGQLDGLQSSIVLESELYRSFGEGTWEFIAKPFYRYDYEDDERTHFDFREFHIRTWREWGALTLGIQKVFWGVTESQHLVDIINQTDSVDGSDGEDKLGQPMIKLTLSPEWGTLDLFVLPIFRERTFPGSRGRLRPSFPILTDEADYESKRGDEHTDFAIRYSHYLGDFDVGLSYFYGTNREPRLIPFFDVESERTFLKPFYSIIHQIGLDLQYTSGGWLWKLETISREIEGSTFLAATGGFEYTYVGVVGSSMDVGFLAEIHIDDEGDESLSVFNNDLFVGLRLAFNDESDSALLLGGTYDLQNHSQLYRAEFSRRMGQSFRLEIELQATANTYPSDLTHSIRHDHFLSLGLRRYF